jgi:hypothetical protein
MKPNFNIELLPEAVDFLENLDYKTSVWRQIDLKLFRLTQ